MMNITVHRFVPVHLHDLLLYPPEILVNGYLFLEAGDSAIGISRPSSRIEE
jgi:hypothetical protein